MGLDTYCYLIFYELTLIYLTGLLSQVVQIICVMRDIYIYINEKRKISYSISLLLLLWDGEDTHNTFRLNLGCRKWKSSLNSDSHTITD